MTDTFIWSQIQRGDQAAFEFFFKSYYKEFYSYAYNYLLQREIAEEIVQDAFIKLWEKKDTLTFNSSIKAYMYSTVRNMSLNYLKSSYAKQKWCSEIPMNCVPVTENINEFMNAEELQHIVAEAIQKLPERCRLVFHLSRHGQMSYDEIANVLDVSKDTVKTQIKIALHRLRVYLTNHWDYSCQA